MKSKNKAFLTLTMILAIVCGLFFIGGCRKNELDEVDADCSYISSNDVSENDFDNSDASLSSTDSGASTTSTKKDDSYKATSGSDSITTTTTEKNAITEKETTTTKNTTTSTTNKPTITTKNQTTTTKKTTTTTQKVTTTTKDPYETIVLNKKTTYFGYEGYFTKSSSPNDIDRSILGLSCDYEFVGAISTEYYDISDDKNIYFAVDTLVVDFIDLKGFVDSGNGRFMVPVRIIGDLTTTTKKETTTTKNQTTTIKKSTTTTQKVTTTTKDPYETIVLYKKTTYFGFTGYFYKKTNGVSIYDPTILGLSSDHRGMGGSCTEYYDVSDNEFVYFAVDNSESFTSKAVAVEVNDTGNKFNIPVRTIGDLTTTTKKETTTTKNQTTTTKKSTTTTQKVTTTTKDPYETITLYKKTTYFGYEGYFYKGNSGIFDPTILGFSKNYELMGGACTEYYDITDGEQIYFATDTSEFAPMFIATEVEDARGMYTVPVRTKI